MRTFDVTFETTSIPGRLIYEPVTVHTERVRAWTAEQAIAQATPKFDGIVRDAFGRHIDNPTITIRATERTAP